MAHLLDGRAYAAQLSPETLRRAEAVAAERGRAPLVALVSASDDPAQTGYVGIKERAARAVGVAARNVALGGGAGATDVVGTIVELGSDDAVDGIFVQFPLEGVAWGAVKKIAQAIPAAKDVDAARGVQSPWSPATPRAVVEVLRHHRVSIDGRSAVVYGEHPDTTAVTRLLAEAGARVTRVTGQEALTIARDTACVGADIVIAGGPPAPFGSRAAPAPPWAGQDVAVVDLGYAAPEPYLPPSWGEPARWWCPARGGLGPATVAVLLEQTVAAAERTL